MPRSLSIVSLLAVGATAASGVQVLGPVTDLPIVNANIAPDGYNGPAVLAGGTFPGPLITGSPTSTFSINVQDRLTDGSMHKSTSIHWHGFFQRGTNWADGPAFVNQCPISPENSFQYNFPANGQAGTFWYHSHYSTQYCDGLRGPIVIYDPNDPYKNQYDVDNATTVITLADWYHSVSTAQTIPARPASTLINGMGRAFSNPTNDTPLFVLNVVKSSRYRLRLVSISCDPHFTFSIDGHTLTIIEVDGINHQPLTVDSLQIFAGQRYSVILQANQNVGNYWIRSLPNNPPNANFDGGVNSAILRYYGAPSVDPTTSLTAALPLVESRLVPLLDPAAPGTPDVNAVDVFAINLALGHVGSQFQINGVAFPNVGPSVPVLLQILSGAQTAQSLLPPGSVYTLPRNKTIQLSLPANVVGNIGGPHPFHLHGHAFSVIRSAGQSGYNFVNPPRRDVVSTGGIADNVTIRFVTDNPGPWFLHCHIDWHLDGGFAAVMAEDAPDVQAANAIPQAWQDLCPIYNNLDPADQ